MHPDLRQTRTVLLDAIRDLTPQHAEAPVEAKWSIAGIVEHLVLTYSRSAAGMRRRVEKGSAPWRSPTFKQRLQQYVVLTLGRFPAGREAPAPLLPQGRSFMDMRAELDHVFEELDASMTAAGGALGMSSRVLDHPVLGPFSANQWCKFHLVHTRHHAAQILARRRKLASR